MGLLVFAGKFRRRKAHPAPVWPGSVGGGVLQRLWVACAEFSSGSHLPFPETYMRVLAWICSLILWWAYSVRVNTQNTNHGSDF